MRVGIIGAGIAGLTLATRLVEEGHSATLLDKGRGVGGRASTRRRDGVVFDHGAQYFTVRDPKFRAFLDARVPAGSLAAWQGRFATLEGGRLVPEVPTATRYVGVPGMSSFARAIATGLDVAIGAKVDRIVGESGRWSLVDDRGREHGPFDWVASSAPPAQSARLLEGWSPIAEVAGRVVMEPCFALMLVPPDGTNLPFDGIRCRHPVLGWAANDHSKPGRGPGPALVIHSGHEWARDHVEDPCPTVAEALRAAASKAFGVALRPGGAESVHRWLFAKPKAPLGRPCLADESARLALCGDWCLAGKVEGAFLSGDACADALLGRSAG